jgi:hypothetical protein
MKDRRAFTRVFQCSKDGAAAESADQGVDLRLSESVVTSRDEGENVGQDSPITMTEVDMEDRCSRKKTENTFLCKFASSFV